MMALALLFPGQGTQHPQMLRWIDDDPDAAPALALLAARVGPHWRDRLADPDWAQGNRVAQALLTGLSLAAWHCLAATLPAPAVIAGYSVGELPAFSAAGVFDAATALRLADRRAEAMERSVAGLDTGLLAVQGLGAPDIGRACAQYGLALAIRLAPDRVVLGGTIEALQRAQDGLDPRGAHCTRLAVHVASHTPWVAAAVDDFARDLAGVDFAAPRAALVCNLGASMPRRGDALKQALAGQIAHTVPWDACMDAIAERRVRCVLEVGPGSTLSRLWNEREPGVPARSVDEFRSAGAVRRWVAAVMG